MNYLRDDEQIKFDVEQELFWDMRIVSDGIDVSVDDGKVTLTGEVNTHSQRRAAAQDAWSTIAVRDVVNELEVKPILENVPSDSEIKDIISNTIFWDIDVSSQKIDVKVESGVVTLTGNVDALWKKEWVEQLAERIRGVILVRNSIAIVPKEDSDDEEIADEISKSLARKMIKSELDKIDVKVKDGKVTFEGSVRDFSTWNQVLDTARYRRGVKKVSDELEFDWDTGDQI